MKLIRLSAKLKKGLGIVTDKTGDYIDRNRIVDFKKFSRPKKEEPKPAKNKLKSEKAIKKERDETKGLY